MSRAVHMRRARSGRTAARTSRATLIDRTWAALLLTAFAIAAVPTAGLAQGRSPDAFDRLSTCIEEEGRLVVLALVDESASLRRTDPDGIRVDALSTVVRNVVAIGERSEDPGAVELGFASFSTEYAAVSDWLPASEADQDALLAHAASFAGRDAGIDTDFATAFTGARDALAARTAEITESEQRTPCTALLTFTDGEYDLEPRSRETAYAPGAPLDVPGNVDVVEAAGRELLCADGGVADDLYDADHVLLTVALSGEIDPADQAFLQGLTTGDGCGSTADDAQGAWLTADDLTGLVFAFDAASTGIAGGLLAEDAAVTPCPRTACDSGSTTFELDETLSRFHLLVSAPPPLQVLIAGPDDQPVDLRAADADVAGAQLQVVRLGDVHVIDGELPLPATWAGEWTVTFIDPTGEAEDLLGRTQVVLFGGLTPLVAVAGDARGGEQLAIDVIAAGEDGAPRTPAGFLEQIDVDLQVTDPTTGTDLDIELDVAEDGTWRYVADVPDDIASSSLEVVAQLDARTASGIDLPRSTSRLAIPVLPPASFPRVEPATLALPPLAGPGAHTTELTLIGGEDPGCVALGTPRIAGPADDAPQLDVRGLRPGGCTPVAPGQTVAVEVVISREGNAAGDVAGVIPVVLRSDVVDGEVTRDIAVTGELITVVDGGKRAALFAIILLASTLVPLIVVHLANRAAARFRTPANHRVAHVPVRVTPHGQVQRQDDDRWTTLALVDADFQRLDVPPGDLRDVQVAPGLALRAIAPWSPFRAPRGLVDAATPSVGSSGDGRTPTVPLALSGAWVLRTTGGDDDGRTGVLTAFISDAVALDTVRDVLVDDITRRIPGLVAQLPAPAPDGSADDQPDVPGDPERAAPEATRDAVDESAWTPAEAPAGAGEWAPVGGGAEPAHPTSATPQRRRLRWPGRRDRTAPDRTPPDRTATPRPAPVPTATEPADAWVPITFDTH